MREDGFKELNNKYGSKYDFWESAKYENAHKYDYFQNGEMHFNGYFDTKANGIYYEQSTPVRAFLTIKKVGAFYNEIFILWGVLGFGCVIYSAN
jgi:hypothetical protein